MKIDEGRRWFYLVLIAVLPVLFLHRILFTDQIINATDISTQYFWEVLYYGDKSYLEWLGFKWSSLSNFGGDSTRVIPRFLLPYRYIVFAIFPPSLGIAWEAVTHIILAGIGTYLYCRVIGLQRYSSFFAAVAFMLSAELITLINAGHIGKISTISWTPIIFFFLEKGFQEKKPFYFMITGGFLAVQFFEIHWQISFYNCLAVGFYFIFRLIDNYLKNRDIVQGGKLVIFGVLLTVIFFSASLVSFLPTYEFSKTSDRAGGMAYEEGMSWSMPPEELVTYVIPGFFGFNRRESVYNPIPIDIYYWGRMWFTQTTDYLGLLPIILAASALAFKRNRYVWLFASLALTTQLIALGKYTPVYRFIYEYIPGFSMFRVPKMILFLQGFSVAVMAGIGLDWVLYSEDGEKRNKIRKIIYTLIGILVISGLAVLYAWIDMDRLMLIFKSDLTRPSRHINDPYLPYNRYINILQGALLFVIMTGLSASLLWFILRDKVRTGYIQAIMVLFLIVDLWIVNKNFLSTAPVPDYRPTEAIKFLKKDKENFRVLPITGTGGEFLYTHYEIPILFGYNPVVEKELAEIRDRIDLDSRWIDLMNVKYIIMSKNEVGEPANIGSMMGKYMIVFKSGGEVVLLNTKYRSRAYPVHQAVIEKDKYAIFNIVENEKFNPWEMAVMSESPPVPLSDAPVSSLKSKVMIDRYTDSKISLSADMADNGFLVLSEKYYPGWKAYVDGKEAKIYRANYVMRAVYLSKGPHKVEFVFDPWAYKTGLWVSSATFLLLLGALIWRSRENG